MTFFYKTSFNFSAQAKYWIINRYRDRFNNKFFHDLDITQYDQQSQTEWQQSIAGQELADFLSLYNCDASYYGIATFISNDSAKVFSNPHMDTKFSKGNSYRIKSRFNVMVLGNPDDPMVWWNHMTYGDSRMPETEFTSITGTKYTSKSIPGNNAEERWNYLGTPSATESGLLTPSAFVQTDCAHAVILSPEPRLIVTVALDKTIEEIVG
jgi:hypothetical protein